MNKSAKSSPKYTTRTIKNNQYLDTYVKHLEYINARNKRQSSRSNKSSASASSLKNRDSSIPKRRFTMRLTKYGIGKRIPNDLLGYNRVPVYLKHLEKNSISKKTRSSRK